MLTIMRKSCLLSGLYLIFLVFLSDVLKADDEAGFGWASNESDEILKSLGFPEKAIRIALLKNSEIMGRMFII